MKKENENIILLIDSERLILDIVEEIFEFEGFKTITALDGKEAFKKLNNSDEVKLILTEVKLSGTNGIELSKKIRKNPKFENIKIAYLTEELFSDDELKELKELGISEIIQKPFDVMDLAKRVKKILA